MNYYMGIDLARKTDWTVATVIDGDGHVVAMDRFHQISWSLQVERCVFLYRTFHCLKATVDSTGLGDVVIEQLEAEGLVVEPYIFTVPSRRALIEELVLAFDNCEISIPATEKFKVFRSEIEAFEYTLDGSTIRYEAPSGHHNDTVMSLALAVHCWHGSLSAVLGLIDLLKRRAKGILDGIFHPDGSPVALAAPKLAVRKPGPVIVRVEGPPKRPNDPCPACKSTSTVVRSDGQGRPVLACNQCSAVDGLVASSHIGCEPGCPAFVKQICAGRIRCGNCGKFHDQAPAAVGMSRAELTARQSIFGRSFGRFQ